MILSKNDRAVVPEVQGRVAPPDGLYLTAVDYASASPVMSATAI